MQWILLNVLYKNYDLSRGHLINFKFQTIVLKSRDRLILDNKKPPMKEAIGF